jgi:pyruvate dehydrogenase E1 component alpha subunit
MVAQADEQIEVTREHALKLLAEMLRIRCFEDRCAQLYSEGKIRGFLHLYNGEEGVAVGVMQSLLPQDSIIGTYREHGHALARGVSMPKLMAELFGKVDGCCRGRGGSMHIFDVGKRFYGGNAIVGGCLPLALGFGLAAKLQNSDAIAVCFFGEGAVAEGEFHESLNLASLWNLPVMFVCENNYYAMGTALARSHAQSDFAAKLAAYRVGMQSVDGMDVLEVERRARELIEYVRASRTPVFMEARTYRLRAHSMYDPQLYRSKEEVKEWEERGPLITLTRKLKRAGLMTEADFLELKGVAEAQVDEAVAYADLAALEPVEELERFIYAQSGT